MDLERTMVKQIVEKEEGLMDYIKTFLLLIVAIILCINIME